VAPQSTLLPVSVFKRFTALYPQSGDFHNTIMASKELSTQPIRRDLSNRYESPRQNAKVKTQKKAKDALCRLRFDFCVLP
jgi:hypothetical protein